MLGALIGAGASLLGGLLNKNSQEKQQAQNIALQKQFAQSGIQWKVEDAKKAGIHPLYALGASTTSFSPTSVGSSLGDSISQAGQNIGRAVSANSSKDETFDQTVRALTLKKMGLENDLLASQIANMNTQRTIGVPTASQRWLVDGQGETALPGLVVDQPLKRVPGDPSSPHVMPGAITDVQPVRTEGGLYSVPPKDLAESIEDNIWHQTMHFLRNNIIPTFTHNVPKAFGPAEPGYKWIHDPVYGWRQKKKSTFGGVEYTR